MNGKDPLYPVTGVTVGVCGITDHLISYISINIKNYSIFFMSAAAGSLQRNTIPRSNVSENMECQITIAAGSA